ncbi:hypothetical protein KC332_g7725 [Hortaea werneckii]|uniref:Trichothecene 3-O-acetyltransferase n=1 Tax=Hortaea werneckii TaxID=91943 RepID=A0A3M7II64_HORWE|nr:hypothetical protein KC358_g7465 [Hortaea werneckii]KAI6847566.1 hypothetical protein KC350_g3396 [Hortaea werneckii]KAI6929279.1 hypothetical protein KC348_g7880 [Hortaea werneckii]KAI6934813.1 hypothetical protein KC341_g7361 [Hortaea werneckii]KAI6969573.1 hypothetical protein KC321_g7808 [Hortaea werneckii]
MALTSTTELRREKMQASVCRSGSAWVEPVRTIQPETVQCSAVENLCARVYPSPVCFFPLQPDDDAYQHFRHMRQALSRVLFEIPILSGIIRVDARGANSVEIPEAPRAGTRLHFRDLSQDAEFPTYDQLAQTGFPFADGEGDGLKELRPDPFPGAQDGDPVVVPLVSLLKGGIAVYCAYSHLIGDLVVGRDIVVRWAANTRAIAEAATSAKPSPPVGSQFAADLMDRSRLTPTNSDVLSIEELQQRGNKLGTFKPLDPTDIAGTMAELQNLMPKAHIPTAAEHDEDRLRETTVGVWHFSMKQLKEIQAMAQQSAPSETKLTTMDAFTAFLWQRFFCAKYGGRETDGSMPEESTCCFAGDVRRRLDPPLPQNYLPAAADVFKAKLGSKELLPSDQSSGLGKTATVLRQVNDNWNREEYLTLIELVHRSPQLPCFIPRGPMDLLITDHSRAAAIMSTSWGPGLGKPAAFREPYLGRSIPAGEITILPRWENGDIEVMIAGETVTIERLSSDAMINKASERQFIKHDVLQAANNTNAVKARL